MSMFDLIVVGGGIAGLTAAAFASKGGSRVAVLEASGTLGGRARTRTISGYHFNQGAHALYRDGFLDAALKDLGIALPGNVPALDTGFFVADGRLHRAPFGAEALAATTLLSDAEKGELASLLGSLIDGSTEVPPGVALNDALTGLTQSERVCAALAAMIRLTGIMHAPHVADGHAFLDQLRGALMRNARYLDGGWGAMIESLAAACTGFGVDLRSSSPVALVERRPGWHARLRDGTTLTARAIVLAVNPAQAAALYPSPGKLHAATAATPAKAACLDLGLARLPRPDILFALDIDRPLYFSVHSAAARLAPNGAALVHAMRYIEPGETPDRQALMGELEGFIDLVQPGWRALEQGRQFLGAMPVHSSLPLAARHGSQGRPDITVADCEGLFIAGDWVGPAGMLSDAAAASGRRAGEAAAAFARSRELAD